MWLEPCLWELRKTKIFFANKTRVNFGHLWRHQYSIFEICEMMEVTVMVIVRLRFLSLWFTMTDRVIMTEKPKKTGNSWGPSGKIVAVYLQIFINLFWRYRWRLSFGDISGHIYGLMWSYDCSKFKLWRVIVALVGHFRYPFFFCVIAIG